MKSSNYFPNMNIDFKDTQIHDNLNDGFCQRYDSDHTSAYKHLLYLGIENFIFLTNYSIPSGDSGGFFVFYIQFISCSLNKFR
ncbi:hypothetical protein CQ022_02230 [Chryseobacterium culicis]|uniref:Uncharacterized protein n=1 Tax=Chryseobacterium culicis TaxID=680127 RepID=A0A2S9CX60_CHRCI|nr:hypothetical protein CQ022_02230 [Chryseobacterium culicis]PRB91171.1 hypothetical protein CQ033_10760 [Chryseobacterium culicis]